MAQEVEPVSSFVSTRVKYALELLKGTFDGAVLSNTSKVNYS